MSENATQCVQVDLSDFTQIMQVGFLWGVDRRCQASGKVSEGNLEIGIAIGNGQKSHDL